MSIPVGLSVVNQRFEGSFGRERARGERGRHRVSMARRKGGEGRPAIRLTSTGLFFLFKILDDNFR